MATDSNSPLYFDCHLCGDCCSSWNIPIESEKAEVLLNRSWVQERLDAHNRSLVRISKETYRLPLTDENVCVFLGEDRRCLIEVNEGSDLKPTDCKRFPFASVEFEDGTTRHDTSAVCKHLSEKLLLAFQPILPKPDEAARLKKLFAEDGLEYFPKHVKVDLFRKGPWQAVDSYWEKSLKQVFSDSECSTEEAVWRIRQVIRDWTKAKEEYFSPKKKLRFTSWVTSCFLRKPYGTFSWLELFRGKQYEDSRIFGFSVDLKNRENVDWDPVLDKYLNAFLYNILIRKRLLSRGASLESLFAMSIIAMLLVKWYAVTLASLRIQDSGDKVITLESDVTMAIRLVERYYTGHQPRFLRKCCKPWRGALLLRLMM
jgi:Fe-S-cluster containining protein